MAQIIRITSEALQATIRRLLPSQQGFGEDLQASNVIQPIIDLTPTAEGSSVPQNLQTALAFGSQTAFDVSNTTTTIVNNAGFFRIFGIANMFGSGDLTFDMSDGLANKQLLKYAGVSSQFSTTPFDFVLFLRAGDSLSVTSGSVNIKCVGSTRQIADVNGVLTNPVGFTPQ